MERDYKASVANVEAQWLGPSKSQMASFTDEDEEEFPKSNLQYFPKRQEKSMRPFLHANFSELLCYFRLYVTTVAKTQMICVMEENINAFVWHRILNAVFRSFSQVFVQIFIASYVPEEHFYLSKMNPMMFGQIFTVIIAGFFELMLIMNTNVFMLDFLVQSITESGPWNRCDEPFTKLKMNGYKLQVMCYTLNEFGKKIRDGNLNNQTLFYYDRVYFYKNATNAIEYFQLSQILHYRKRIIYGHKSFHTTVYGVYFIAIWIAAALLNNHIFKKTMWKVLKISNIIEIIIYVMSLFYIYVFDDVMYNYDPKKITNVKSTTRSKPILIDESFVSLSLNAPPVSHVLYSRYNTDPSKVNFNLFSVIVVASNCLYGFLIGFTNLIILRHSEYSLGAKIIYADQNINVFFYFYPIYFSRFTLGNIFLTILLFFKFFSDFFMFVITFQCLIECIVWEWRYATKLMMTAVMVIFAIISYLIIKYKFTVALYMYFKGAVDLCEVYTIFFIYPLHRLIEDITFHSGSSPNRMRIWSLRVVPIYVTYKLYTTFIQMSKIKLLNDSKWTWVLPVIVILSGIIYGVVQTMYVEKRRFAAIFCPEPEWGPTDDVLRYCRKLYSMQNYIESQADRNLSRYMMKKSETETYRVDVKYGAAERRATVIDGEWQSTSAATAADRQQTSSGTAMRYEDEKKLN